MGRRPRHAIHETHHGSIPPPPPPPLPLHPENGFLSPDNTTHFSLLPPIPPILHPFLSFLTHLRGLIPHLHRRSEPHLFVFLCILLPLPFLPSHILIHPHSFTPFPLSSTQSVTSFLFFSFSFLILYIHFSFQSFTLCLFLPPIPLLLSILSLLSLPPPPSPSPLPALLPPLQLLPPSVWSSLIPQSHFPSITCGMD